MGMSDAKPAAKPEAAKKPAKKAEHPPSAVMVLAAVKALKEKNGSSLVAIKKYIAANYKVDIVKVAPFIRKAVKKLVEGKKLAAGKTAARFKAVKEEKPKVKNAKKTPKKAKKAKTPKKAAKKAKTPKKAAKKPAAKKTAAKKPAAKKTPKKAAKKAAPKKK